MSHAPASATRESRLAVERPCDRIDRLVQNLLVVSRVRSRSLQLYVRKTELASIVQLVANELMARGREVSIEILPTPSVYVDGERIASALRNMAYDAIARSPPRTPLVFRLSLHDAWAELGVVYRPLPVADRTYADIDEYDDTKLSRCATETIVNAHAGELGEDSLGDEALIWARLPVSEER